MLSHWHDKFVGGKVAVNGVASGPAVALAVLKILINLTRVGILSYRGVGAGPDCAVR